MTNSNLPCSKKFFDTTISIKITYKPMFNLKSPENYKKEKQKRYKETLQIEEFGDDFKKLVILNKDNKNFINRIYNYITN